jgi:hypothetical protein
VGCSADITAWQLIEGRMSRPTYIVVVADSFSNQQLLRYVRNRYPSEDGLISELAKKIQHPQITSVNFSKIDDKVHVHILIRDCNKHSARYIVYDFDYASERTATGLSPLDTNDDTQEASR